MRSLICGIVLTSLVAGCSKSATEEYDVVTIEETETDQPSDQVTVTGNDEAAPQGEATADAAAPAPTFADLVGVDDKKYSLDEFKDAKAVAVVFTCNKCPVAVAYEDRLEAFQKDYADKGVQLVAINVNNAEADKLPAMKTRAEEKGFTFPYLYDPSQKTARDFGAKVTPHVFLLDGARQVVYEGPMDDNPEEAQATKAFLREATDAVLEGKAPETTDVEPVGCGIQYE